MNFVSVRLAKCFLHELSLGCPEIERIKTIGSKAVDNSVISSSENKKSHQLVARGSTRERVNRSSPLAGSEVRLSDITSGRNLQHGFAKLTTHTGSPSSAS